MGMFGEMGGIGRGCGKTLEMGLGGMQVNAG